MADNFQASNGSQTYVFAADDIGAGVLASRVKVSVGPDGVGQDNWTGARVVSASSTNATSVKASAGAVGSIIAFNLNAAVRFLKLYNKASAPTVGVDVPVATLPIPGNTAGAGFSLSIPQGVAFTTGIALALTTGYADGDTGAVAAGDLFLWLAYA